MSTLPLVFSAVAAVWHVGLGQGIHGRVMFVICKCFNHYLCQAACGACEDGVEWDVLEG